DGVGGPAADAAPAVLLGLQLNFQPAWGKPVRGPAPPFHDDRCLAHIPLEAQVLQSAGVLEAVQVRVDEDRLAPAVAVVVYQGKGGARHPLLDAYPLPDALDEDGLPGA